MSAVDRIKLEIYRGTTLRKLVTWKTGSSVDSADPVDLTGYSAHLQVRASADDPVVLLELNTDNGGIVLGGTAGTLEIVVDETLTQDATWTDGVYDVVLNAPNGDVLRLFGGKATLLPTVTREVVAL